MCIDLIKNIKDINWATFIIGMVSIVVLIINNEVLKVLGTTFVDINIIIFSNMLSMARQQSLATTGARLYLTRSDSGHRQWQQLVTGAICFVKDFNRKAYLIAVRQKCMKQ